jgi:hypothetical protein
MPMTPPRRRMHTTSPASPPRTMDRRRLPRRPRVCHVAPTTRHIVLQCPHTTIYGLPTAHHVVPRCTNTTTMALHPARRHPAQDTMWVDYECDRMPEVRIPDRQGRWQRGGRQHPTDTVTTPHPCTARSARAVHSNPLHSPSTRTISAAYAALCGVETRHARCGSASND